MVSFNLWCLDLIDVVDAQILDVRFEYFRHVELPGRVCA